ncbi:MAG: hypothetical protein QM756_37150 [Polyangiaceae bacterium]
MNDTRSILHTIVQGSTVDLFHSHGIAVAPITQIARGENGLEAPANGDLLGSITFSGRGCTGTLIVSMPEAVFALLKQEPGRPFAGRDWIREAANQLLGRIKNRLMQFQVSISSGLPSTPGRDAIERLRGRSSLFLGYGFRTLRGRICVALGGEIDHSMFVYTGARVNLPNEGDIILF